jgi:hypothetical protein
LIVVIYFELLRKLRIDHLLLLPPPPTFHIAGGRNGDWGRVYSGLRVSVANRDLVPAS